MANAQQGFMPASYNYPGIGSGSGSGGSATPGGVSGSVQFNQNGTSFGGDNLFTYISSTLSVGGVSATQQITTSSVVFARGGTFGVTPFQTNGTASQPVLSVAQPNTGFYEPNTSVLGITVNSSNVLRLSTQGLALFTNATATAPLEVSGTISATGIVIANPGVISTTRVTFISPTTLPACGAAQAGQTFYNTTTKCLNYCDGTANRQVTSLAATCT